MVQLSEENLNKLAMKEKYNSLFASVKLNSSCYLSKENLSECLCHSVPLDCLNLRPVSSQVITKNDLILNSTPENRL